MISSSSQCTYRTISGSQKLQVLQDAWAQCAGEWRKSELFKKFTERTTSSSFGARIWLTRAQIAKKYDSQSIADQICDAKVADPELAATQTKWHPDAPGVEAGPELAGDRNRAGNEIELVRIMRIVQHHKLYIFIIYIYYIYINLQFPPENERDNCSVE